MGLKVNFQVSFYHTIYLPVSGLNILTAKQTGKSFSKIEEKRYVHLIQGMSNGRKG